MEDIFLDPASVTAEQRFALMLHERVERIESDHAKVMAFLFSPPKVIAEISKPIYEKLKALKATFQHLTPTAVDKNTGRNLIPHAAFAALPACAVTPACDFARLTKSPHKHAHIFDYAITVIERCGAVASPDIIAWIDEFAEENVRKLEADA